MKTNTFLLFLILIWACSSHDDYIQESGVTFKLAVPTPLSGTGAETNENAIESLLVVQFTAQGEYIRKDVINDINQGNIKQIRIDSITKNESIIIYFIANIPEVNQNIDKQTTLSCLEGLSLTWTDNFMNGMPMVAYFEGKVTDGTPLPEVILKRLVSKIDFSVTNEIPHLLELISMRIEQIPPLFHLGLHNLAPFPHYNEADGQCKIIDIRNGIQWTGYLPENRRGKGSATESYCKTILTAPINEGNRCTRIIVSGNYTPTAGDITIPIDFTFFPGANATDDYNLNINSLYKMRINIKGVDNWDCRISYINGSTTLVSEQDTVKQDIPF
ncbi:MAG: hypothetical protein ACRDDZ_07080 [Marinifilaceae bacterium]